MVKVYIHPAKGGREYGATTYDGLYEKELTLQVAQAVRDILRRHGVDVMMSRDKDESLGVIESIKRCNLYDADLGVFIEFGNSQDGAVRGFEVHSSFDETSLSYVAAQIINKYVLASGFKSNGVLHGNQYDRYAFIRETNCPAVLCRCCYIDNILDCESFNIKNTAENIAKGILEYFDIEYVEKFYSVQIGMFDNIEDANKLRRELVAKGYKATII